MFPEDYFTGSYFTRYYWPADGTTPTLPAMPTFTGYVIVTIDGVRYALAAARLDP